MMEIGSWGLVNTSMKSMSCCSNRTSQMGKVLLQEAKRGAKMDEDEA